MLDVSLLTYMLYQLTTVKCVPELCYKFGPFICVFTRELGWRPRICATELTTLIYTVTIKNQSYLLFWISKFIFIMLFLFFVFQFLY
jgi:hypothetical protein